MDKSHPTPKPLSPHIENADLAPASGPSPDPTHSLAGRPVSHQRPGQGDGQAERQGQPEDGHEWNALLPASLFCLIVPQTLKDSLFLSRQIIQGAPVVLPIGSKAGVQGFQPVEGGNRLCCTNPVRDSSCESIVVAGRHEQTYTPRLQDPELACL